MPPSEYRFALEVKVVSPNKPEETIKQVNDKIHEALAKQKMEELWVSKRIEIEEPAKPYPPEWKVLIDHLILAAADYESREAVIHIVLPFIKPYFEIKVKPLFKYLIDGT